jgi:hypothetical protein
VIRVKNPQDKSAHQQMLRRFSTKRYFVEGKNQHLTDYKSQTFRYTERLAARDHVLPPTAKVLIKLDTEVEDGSE